MRSGAVAEGPGRIWAEKSYRRPHPMGPLPLSRPRTDAGHRVQEAPLSASTGSVPEVKESACHGDGVQGQQSSRTLVLIVGVMLALVAGAGVFYLSSQGGRSERSDRPRSRRARSSSRSRTSPRATTIDLEQLTTRVVPADATNETAFTDPTQVAGGVAAVTILALQPISPNLLAGASDAGDQRSSTPTETISPTSPHLARGEHQHPARPRRRRASSGPAAASTSSPRSRSRSSPRSTRSPARRSRPTS